jgi:hypothetical protein
MPTLTQAAESTQPVEQQVIPPAGVTPTSDSVFMAFVSQPSFGLPVMPAPASPAWNTASWVTDSDGTFWASCLVGPELGGIVLAAGAYVIAVRVVDSAARPEIFGWELNVV